jgi:hypothetical protein
VRPQSLFSSPLFPVETDRQFLPIAPITPTRVITPDKICSFFPLSLSHIRPSFLAEPTAPRLQSTGSRNTVASSSSSSSSSCFPSPPGQSGIHLPPARCLRPSPQPSFVDPKKLRSAIYSLLRPHSLYRLVALCSFGARRPLIWQSSFGKQARGLPLTAQSCHARSGLSAAWGIGLHTSLSVDHTFTLVASHEDGPCGPIHILVSVCMCSNSHTLPFPFRTITHPTPMSLRGSLCSVTCTLLYCQPDKSFL